MESDMSEEDKMEALRKLLGRESDSPLSACKASSP